MSTYLYSDVDKHTRPPIHNRYSILYTETHLQPLMVISHAAFNYTHSHTHGSGAA